MAAGLVVFFVVLGSIAAYVMFTFNQLINLKHNVGLAWSNIDVLLRQRHDELPKLVETCRQYMKFEQETLEKVMQARTQVASARDARDVAALGQAEVNLRASVGRLFALAEAYPELKTSEQFQHLQARISALENAIADRREFYNDSVNISNVRIEQFPDNVVAAVFGFKAFQLLRFDLQETADANLGTLFKG